MRIGGFRNEHSEKNIDGSRLSSGLQLKRDFCDMFTGVINRVIKDKTFE